MSDPAPTWAHDLGARLGAEVRSIVLVGGGASNETWAVETDASRLIVRRASGGSVYSHMLTLEEEFKVLERAAAGGVRVPKPVAYLGELGGQQAFAMERVDGETLGRRIVHDTHPRLGDQLAAELARIHALPADTLPFLPRGDALDRLQHELSELPEPHPAIEFGIAWLRDHRPGPLPPVVCHGDFRIGNVVVSHSGLEAILDWELAQLGDPREDIGWLLVRSWRFGRDELRVGGVADLGPFLAAYSSATGCELEADDLRWWEILGNVKWAIGSHAQARRHLSGAERSVELAVIGRLAVQVEYELLDLIGKTRA